MNLYLRQGDSYLEQTSACVLNGDQVERVRLILGVGLPPKYRVAALKVRLH